MTDRLSSPKSMLSRAKRQIVQLQSEITGFTDEKPWAYLIEEDPDGPKLVHKVKFTKRLSEDLAHIIFETANNLRAVLDQLGFAVAVISGNAAPKACKFPFGLTEVLMRNNAKGGCKDLPAEIRSLFISFKPYKGGNNTLWALNELANTPKHKILYPTAIGRSQFDVSHISVIKPGDGGVDIMAPFWNSEKNEIAFLKVPRDAEVNYDIDVSFSVALNDVDEVIRGQHPVTVLSVMAAEVQNVLDLSETMCRCIGLLK